MLLPTSGAGETCSNGNLNSPGLQLLARVAPAIAVSESELKFHQAYAQILNVRNFQSLNTNKLI